MKKVKNTETLFQAHYHQKVWRRMQTNVSFSQGEILDDFNEIAFATPLNIVALESYQEKLYSQANVQ